MTLSRDAELAQLAVSFQQRARHVIAVWVGWIVLAVISSVAGQNTGPSVRLIAPSAIGVLGLDEEGLRRAERLAREYVRDYGPAIAWFERRRIEYGLWWKALLYRGRALRDVDRTAPLHRGAA